MATQVIDTRHHDLKTGQVVSFEYSQCGRIKAVPGKVSASQYPTSYASVRAMQRELLRRNRAQIRAGRRCCILTHDGVIFYEYDAHYSYRTVQYVRFVP